MKNYFEIWAGSELTYKQAQIGLEKTNAEPRLDSGEEFNPQDFGLLTISDGIGVINIQGSMVTNASAYASYWGVIGYNVIKDTLTYAAQDPEIKTILLNIDSGGGSASGIDSVASLVSKISVDYKPVISFTEGTMCSAAYWLASAADEVYSTRLATVGSIGVIAVSMEYTKMMEQDGVTATVFRAGEFKALGSPYEVLDEKASEEIQNKLDLLYSEFITNISAERGLPQATAKTSWAEGRTFLGFQALENGLVDQITTFEDLTSNMKKKCEQQQAGRINLSTGDDMARKKLLLSEQSTALLAAGVPLDAALTAEPETVEEATPTETAPQPAETATETSTEHVAVPSEMASFFTTQLAEANEKVINLTLENREMKTKLETIDVTHNQLRAIAIDAINLRNIGLGRGAIDLSTAGDEVVLSTFSNVSKEFNNIYKVGGVTEVASVEREKVQPTQAEKRAIRAATI